jgi:hypothetical protein
VPSSGASWWRRGWNWRLLRLNHKLKTQTGSKFANANNAIKTNTYLYGRE